MHQLIILLTKAKSVENAQNYAESFIEGFEGELYDYYSYGGRWDGCLNGENIAKATSCADFINEYKTDLNVDIIKYKKQLLRELREKELNKSTAALAAKEFMYACHDQLSSISTIYDIDKQTNTVPKNLKGYYAVAIDIHC